MDSHTEAQKDTPVVFEIDRDRRWNLPPLFSTWCGRCRWGAENVAKSVLVDTIKTHLIEHHDGDGTIVDNTTNLRTYFRFLE